MKSNFSEKFKESAISVVPVMIIVLILNFTICPLREGALSQFIVGGILLILGLAIFLIGADLGMVPFGQKVGSYLTHKRTLLIMIPAAFLIGFAVTIAEPDVQVLADQVHAAVQSMNNNILLLMIAAGVGLFLVLGMLRTVLQLPLSWLLIFFYVLVFVACSFVEPAFIGVAFDAGGATTGPVTVPFIMALGIGVAATFKKKEGDDSSFGLVGLASVGPIVAVAFMGMVDKGGMNSGEFEKEADIMRSLFDQFWHIMPEVSYHMLLALLPLVIIFGIFQLFLVRMPFQQIKRMLLGFLYTFIGLVIFMTGVNGGFIPAGQSLGMVLGPLWHGNALIPVGLILGAVVVCAEPAVWVLTEQVEEVSGGHIRRPIMLAALSISIACAVGLGMLRVVTGMSILFILIPGYVLALVLTKLCPPLFTAIAFDSGGVASGPMSTTFVLSLTLGASVAVGGNPVTDAFGMIAMIAMAPLITIQILGLIFRYKEKQTQPDKKQE